MRYRPLKDKITIRMPKKLLRKWLKALRSGEFKQAKEKLHKPETGGFCCLGVLQYVATGGYVETMDDGSYRTLPSEKWLKDHGIEFVAGNSEISVPDIAENEYGTKNAAALNDAGCKFETIANFIEACAEGY